MADRLRTVLHVLPHSGGGGEKYVETLARMDGYHLNRLFLASAPRRRREFLAVVRNAARVPSAAGRHDVLHVHGEVASAVCLPSIAVRPSVVTLHGLHLLRRASGLTRVAARTNLRLVVRAAGRTICVSEAEREDLLAVVGDRWAEAVVAIRNGVIPLARAERVERAAARAQLRLSDEVTVGLLGALDTHKDPLVGARAAIELARQGEPFVLLIVGDGTWRPELSRLASGSHGSVRVLGFRQNIRQVLVAADFFVSSSRREGLPTPLEAMSLGLPPVVSDAPGNPEAVADSGIVVSRGDVSGFASAYRRLLRDANERRTLGQRARDRVEQHFHASEMIRRTREVYELVGRGDTG